MCRWDFIRPHGGGFFSPQRFSEGGIQIHKNLYDRDFHELHSDSPALTFFPNFQVFFLCCVP